jgi:3-hydroxyacyl-CoA dehydrogenase/enoyl-CoA hydratase/3-hydroxybutyryl-CoA epimerase
VAAQTTYEGFDQADLIVEAVFEDLDLKRRVLAEAEAVMREDCVFASNTSALPIADIAKGCRRPANVLGMHYFSPVPAMPLLEIIVAPKTSEAALKTAVALGAAQGKTVIVVKDGPGFYTTRILAAYLNETGLLLEEGASIEQLDRAMTTFGFPVGPVTLIDEVGLDVAAHVGKFLGGWFNEARGIKASDGVQRMFAAGYKGRKNKKGFYVYERPAQPKWQKYVPWTPKRKKEPDPAAYQFFGGERRALDDGLIQRRHAFVMVNEALLCLQEGVLSSPTDGDLGAILGLGFPPFRGGPFRYVDAFGAAKLAANMEALAGTYGPQFKPCALLLDTAKTGQKFYP